MITSIFFRNGHKAPPKSLGHLRLREPRRQPLQKFAQKAPQPTALNPPSTARTAGRSGGCGGACDASPLSCFLFRPRKSREKRRKRSHINASNASVIWASRVSQTPLQAPFPTSINGYHAAKKFLSQWPAKRSTFAFAGESGYTLAFANRIAHSGLHAETGAFRTGPLSLPSAHSARSRTSPGRVSERQTLPLLGLGRGCAPEERREPAEQRCAYARRCSEASRPRWAA